MVPIPVLDPIKGRASLQGGKGGERGARLGETRKKFHEGEGKEKSGKKSSLTFDIKSAMAGMAEKKNWRGEWD